VGIEHFFLPLKAREVPARQPSNCLPPFIGDRYRYLANANANANTNVQRRRNGEDKFLWANHERDLGQVLSGLHVLASTSTGIMMPLDIA